MAGAVPRFLYLWHLSTLSFLTSVGQRFAVEGGIMARGIPEYERMRNNMIAKNKEVLKELGLATLAANTFKKPADPG